MLLTSWLFVQSGLCPSPLPLYVLVYDFSMQTDQHCPCLFTWECSTPSSLPGKISSYLRFIARIPALFDPSGFCSFRRSLLKRVPRQLGKRMTGREASLGSRQCKSYHELECVDLFVWIGHID